MCNEKDRLTEKSGVSPNGDANRGSKKQSCAKNSLELPKTARQIKGSKDYADIDGSIYTYVSNYKGQLTSRLIKKKPNLEHNCGYLYIAIYSNEQKRIVTRRLNRVIAETFIPNPFGLPVVGHKNNIKTDNRVENLYWTTYAENTRKAVMDGLMEQTSGIDDSQSKPVIMFETTTNHKLAEFGSCRDAAAQTGLSMTTICRQAKYHRPVRKKYYFRYADDETAVVNRLVGHFDYDTDQLLGTYFNVNEAARKTGVNPKTVSIQCNKGCKPKHKFSQTYFLYLK